MNQDLVTIDKANTGDASVDNYFQTARYADEAIQQVFQQLKESGLYDHSMIVLYGDHYGISDNHNKAMEQVIGKRLHHMKVLIYNVYHYLYMFRHTRWYQP